ncbi:MAG: hypothetical protein ACJ8GV_11465 [Luteimonas sp.]
MTIPSDALAALDDLDMILGRYDTSEDGQLMKLAVFSRVALLLHRDASASERLAIDATLQDLAHKHALPEGCLPTQADDTPRRYARAALQ